MTLSSHTPLTPAAIARRARALRERVDEVVADIVEAISQAVPRYSGGPDTTSHTVLTEAATTAVHRFLDAIDGAPHRERGIDTVFQSLGRAEAAAGRGMVEFQAALHAGASAAWRGLRRTDAEAGDGADARGDLADAVFDYVNHLERQASLGHEAQLRRHADDLGMQRARLARQLITGKFSGTTTDIWQVPAGLVVAVVELHDGERPNLNDIAQRSLIVRDAETLLILADASKRDDVIATLQGATQGVVAVSWEIPPREIPSAHAWTRRALQLARTGVIETGRVIDCARHRTQIWLHSEPVLRRQLCQELLRPLLAETPNSREILSETLLAWLETRESAPSIAGYLGIHPQTVRYRWKRINELFGDNLHDADFILQITMLLKASVPLWKAGDQSDFELFRAEDSA